jgi:hypothetical protein
LRRVHKAERLARGVKVVDTDPVSNPGSTQGAVEWRVTEYQPERKQPLPTLAKHREDSPTTAFKTLCGLMNPIALKKAFEWLGVTSTEQRNPTVLTEIGNAERFADAYRGDVRYCHQLATWFAWDEVAQVERYAKGIVRQLYCDALAVQSKDAREAMLKFAMRSDSDHGIRALLHRAAAEEGIPVRINELDADP